MKNKIFLLYSAALLAAMAAICSFIITGKIIKADKESSWLQYTVNHPLHKATAVTNNFICNIDFNPETKQINKAAVSAGVGTFDSKNSNRDSNSLEAVEALKFPSVKFISTSITQSENRLTMKGNLTFHGMTKEISFAAEQKTEGNKLTVQGSFKISLDEFKIARPSLFAMKIDDEIVVEFKTVFSI